MASNRTRTRRKSALRNRARIADRLAAPVADKVLAPPQPEVATTAVAQRVAPRFLSVLGVRITDVTMQGAVLLLENLLRTRASRCHSVYFVNAHTLNVSCDQPEFRATLNAADFVFNDGLGVRWAARQRGIELRGNLCGTDLVPSLFEATSGQGYRYFLLGADPVAIERAAAYARQNFPGWTLAGYRHGYHADGDDVIDLVNEAEPHVLLVGMGNPIQERWIRARQARLRVPIAIGVGGLFDLWSGHPRRAPVWVRRICCEWMYNLYKQPYKWRRYVIGNPKFLMRMTRALNDDRAAIGRETSRPVSLSWK